MAADGKMQFTTEEPDNTWTLKMQQILLEPLVAEELLRRFFTRGQRVLGSATAAGSRSNAPAPTRVR